MNRILSWAITLIFLFFAVVNLNDPDGFIWTPIYVAVALLPILRKVDQSYVNQFAVILLVLGALIATGILNDVMPQQVDDRMVNMWEYQREGLGLILGSTWLWVSRKLLS
ncbi:MAG: transmembrane 220 family protein [Candidatus Marinimicrobia bacterium]|nr:transmembrane 220 family protein [Candidatus Neomarinimicrobiota bacterium]MDP6611844.1 transmembrane 220 family protein [Candidatus Neomarinimicrobiota bacterium]